MRDSDIVALLADGDPRGLEAAYEAYADRIHDYARGMLRRFSPDTAADVTHDTFLIAFAKAADLRDRERFRPWLYAIARNECLRVLRAGKRSTELTPSHEPTTEGSPEMSSGLAAAERRALVLAAAEGLAPKDREVFELSMRHDLSAREVAAALGVSDNAAHAMLSRVRSQFERSLGALLVARQGRPSCAGLAELLEGWDGSFQPLWRKRIARHVTSCATCTAVERREVSPAALLAVLPLLPAPALVRSRIFEDKTELVAHSRKLAERAGPWEVDGWPGVVGPRRRRPAVLAVVAVLLLLFGGVESVRLLTADHERDVTEPVDAAVAGTPSSSGPASQASYAVADPVTLRPRPSPSAQRSASASPSATPSETTTAPAPTTAAPWVRPSPTQPPPTPAPPPTTVAPVPGNLLVAPRVLRLPRGGTGTVQLTARGGPVDWSASPDPHLLLSATSGSLASGTSAPVTITLASATPSTVTSQSVLFNGILVTVRVCSPGAAC